ncbi:hypothetical protein VTK56DRAFT_3563 [Thermocarpiscus australiensis]
MPGSKAWASSTKQSVTPRNPSRKGSRFPSFSRSSEAQFPGLGKNSSYPAAEKASEDLIERTAEEETSVRPYSPASTDSVSGRPYGEVQNLPENPSWEALDLEVVVYLYNATRHLPEDIQAVDPPPQEGLDGFDTISRDPILVHSSGIEGGFDIQRVVVTMVDLGKLRRKIAAAADPARQDFGMQALLVSHLIEFTQERELHLVAGERVLGRFSGTPGAHWLLCYFEPWRGARVLLQAAHRHGGAIDFHDSTPEPGFLGAWQPGSRLASEKSGGKLNVGLDLARHGQGMAFKEVRDKEGEAKGTEGNSNDSDSEDDRGPERLLDRILGQRKSLAKASGEYTVPEETENLLEAHADDLDKELAAIVLKHTPDTLRTTLEDMSDTKSFVPPTCRCSVRVHMF